jgi:hypothetical protein
MKHNVLHENFHFISKITTASLMARKFTFIEAQTPTLFGKVRNFIVQVIIHMLMWTKQEISGILCDEVFHIKGGGMTLKF